ncbi:MAG TPA: heavy-metal-associated domain-containing protein [Gemmatimonadales bacterium]|nr:heavy-metal-associated domain-containing protein [Gemmatimonadales bacterium]
MSKVTLHIEGMTCGHCLNAVNRALATQPGTTIESVQIGRAVVETTAAPEALVAAIEDAGYRATAATGGAAQ